MPTKLKDPLKPFRDHGVEFSATSGQSEQADCPFCGKHLAFHVNPETSLWVCSSKPSVCGRKGNLVTFLQQWVEFCHASTSELDWRRLSRARGGLPPEAFRRWGVSFSVATGDWLIPTYSERGTVQDLRRWRPGRRVMATTGCRVGLWGAQQLGAARTRSWPVDICEGEWDGMALAWLNRRIRRNALVVAVPGARVFKDEWAELLQGRAVTWWYDHDSDGYEFSLRASQDYARLFAKQRFVHWPETFPDKFDVRDFIVSRVIDDEVEPKQAFRQLSMMLRAKHRDDKGPSPGENIHVRPASNPSLETTLGVFRKWLKMSPDLEAALRILFAVSLATQMPGSPLWMFLVGPPGSGKTELLLALAKSPDNFYQSSVGPKSLVSGFKQGARDEDPSLIPHMLGKCAIFKDWTEVLTANFVDLDQLYGVLRGAYDGVIERTFGNGVKRVYHGRFNILAGTTNAIHGHSKATVGERFLKFQLQGLGFEETQTLLHAVIRGSLLEDEKTEALQNAAAAFLDRDIPKCDPTDMLPHWVVERLAALAEIIAMLRHTVEWERDGMERLLKYRPVHEVGTRLAQQLCKLAMSLCIVEKKRRVDPDVYRLVERVAFDTGIGFNLDVVEAMMELGGEDVETDELAEHVGINKTGLRRRLEDMRLLGIIMPSKKQHEPQGPGRPPRYWRVSRVVRQLWRLARPYEVHLESAKAGREHQWNPHTHATSDR